LVRLLMQHRRFLENSIVDRRKQNLYRWVTASFMERFGTYGVEQLGGEKQVLSRLNQAGIANPLAGLRLLADLATAKLATGPRE